MSVTKRLHDRAGHRVVPGPMQFVDAASSMATAALRILVGYHPRRPWITLPAYRQLQRMVRSDWKIFEYGSGMSTLWYDRRCAEVHAVEENESWHRFVAAKLDEARVYHREGRAYAEAVLEFEAGYFNLIVVDGKQRLNCFRAVLAAAGPNTHIMIDDTDTRGADADMEEINRIIEGFAPSRILRFPGFADGYFFAKETTIVTPDLRPTA